MKIRALLLASACTVFLTACAATDSGMATGAASARAGDDMAVPAQGQSESEKLHALFAASDEASLKRNPLSALFRGDMRYADQFGDGITDAYYDAERAAAQNDLAALAAIERSQLNRVDAIAYDVFKRDTNDTVQSLSDEILPLTKVRPFNHFYALHTFYPTFASGKGAAPFNTLADYRNNLKRHKGYIVNIDRSIARFRQGMASGVVETKLTTRNMVEQLDNQLAQSVEQSAFYGPILQFPDSFTKMQKAELAREYREMIAQEIYPAHQRLRDFLQNEYLPAAREGAGLSYMKGGAKLYDYMIESTTTLPLKAADVHALGLSEVARIKGEMEAIKKEVGFTGTLQEFFTYLRTDPKFQPASRAALTQGFYAIGKTVDAKIASQFKVLPESPLEIKPYDETIEKFQAGGSYSSGTADGSRPGIFYFNAYDLPSRNVSGMTTLYLHEGAPGHHFQISLAQENEALPNFMRYGGNTAYVEGWALYSEKLGFPMGLYTDPYQRFGHYDDEMLRAMRLVVDTGLHSKSWTREQAIQYMLDNSSMGETDATSEVERYIAIPSQALAYKIGALTIQRLKAKAEAQLGDRFDVREFHDEVLNTGALPMAILEEKIDAWIASKG